MTPLILIHGETDTYCKVIMVIPILWHDGKASWHDSTYRMQYYTSILTAIEAPLVPNVEWFSRGIWELYEAPFFMLWESLKREKLEKPKEKTLGLSIFADSLLMGCEIL